MGEIANSVDQARISVSHYRLQPVAGSSARVADPRVGALLRIETGDGVGYADLHPWPELGDQPLDQQLTALAIGVASPQVRRSLANAELDRNCRQEKKSAFEGLAIPRSHFLMLDISDQEALDWRNLSDFRTLKIKLGRNPDRELSTIRLLRAELSHFRLRFDFNAKLNATQFCTFIDRLDSRVRDAIDFIEDPIPFDDLAWRRLAQEFSLSFALDRKPVTPFLHVPAFDWLIVKPAIDDLDDAVQTATDHGARVVVTSYLDHPIGQVAAAVQAAKIATSGVDCGLASHFVYEQNRYSERLGLKGSILNAPAGTGIGFDDLLAAETWEMLR